VSAIITNDTFIDQEILDVFSERDTKKTQQQTDRQTDRQITHKVTNK